MESVLKYLETISEIDAAENELRKMQEGWKRGRARIPEKLAAVIERIEQAYQAASIAWESIAPDMRGRLCPPPPSILEAQPLS